jgi:hypothetical protein
VVVGGGGEDGAEETVGEREEQVVFHGSEGVAGGIARRVPSAGFGVKFLNTTRNVDLPDTDSCMAR